MGDIFKEQLVKRETSLKDVSIKVGSVILALFVCLLVFIATSSSMIPSSLMPFITIAIAFAEYYFISMKNIEYEYIFTNGELDIDCIYNKNKRKRVFSAEAKSFEIFAHVEDKSHESVFDTATEKKDYSSGKIKDNTYVFVCNYKGKKMKITFEPNESLLKAITPYLGQKNFLKR